jgi:GH24 family phage-related lysozyme (muramidase)
MNLNQRVATLSYFYNCGPYATADKQFEAIREQNWQEAAKQMDIVTSGGEVMDGLVERREIERKLFLTPVK